MQLHGFNPWELEEQYGQLQWVPEPTLSGLPSDEEIVIRKTCNWVTNIQLLDTFLVSVSTGLLFQDYVKKIIHML